MTLVETYFKRPVFQRYTLNVPGRRMSYEQLLVIQIMVQLLN